MTPVMILGSLIIGGSVCADDEGPVCHRCEKIREYNAAHPENNYYWYDDYVKDKKQDDSKPTPTPAEQKEGNAPVNQKAN